MMNIRITSFLKGIPVLGLAVATLLLSLSVRSEGADPPKPRPGIAAPDAAAAWQRRISELVCDNLPLGEIVKELRQRFPEINFLMRNPAGSESDRDVESTSITVILRSVTLQEILKALELAAQVPIQIAGAPDERLVVFEMKREETGLPAVGPQTRVFNLSRYLENRSEEEAAIAMKQLDEVVKTAGDMLAVASPGQRRFNPRLNFHSSTKIMIAVGRPEELQIVEQVVKELQNVPSVNRLSGPSHESKNQPARPGGSVKP